MHYRILFAASAFFVLLLFQCHPERVYIDNSDAKLEFTMDTVYFDTVLTTLGTVTRSFRVMNPYNSFVKISEIRLAGGSSSAFRINIDGLSGPVQENIEIAPHDSMYIFVEATPGENGVSGLLRIQDSIVFVTNGNTQDVDIVAWGQDVHILRDSVLDYDATWIADKPYLIIDGILVDSLYTLNIEPGVVIYLHRDASIYILGSLKVDGTTDEPVIFRGDRLELEYDSYPGQWGFIYLGPESRDNAINNARILNGTFGIWAATEETPAEPHLRISNTFINQVSYDGIFAFNTRIEGYNLAVGDCGNSCLDVIKGGHYTFDQTTFGNYYRSFFGLRQNPSLYLSNYFAYKNNDGDVVVETADLEVAIFRNSIIYGSNSSEIGLDGVDGTALNYLFDHCLARVDYSDYDYESDPSFVYFFPNEDPKFDSISYSLELDTLSAAKDRGFLDYAMSIPYDLNGNSRVEDGKPDLGAYERKEE